MKINLIAECFQAFPLSNASYLSCLLLQECLSQNLANSLFKVRLHHNLDLRVYYYLDFIHINTFFFYGSYNFKKLGDL